MGVVLGASTPELLRAIASLFSAIAWPAAAVAVVVVFRRPLSDFLGQLSSLRIKAAGVDLEATRRQVTAALGAATAMRPTDAQNAPFSPRDIAQTVARATQASAVGHLSGAHALWVDDHPENNVFERQSLEALGVSFELATTTRDAVAAISVRAFNVIISDLGRSTAAEQDESAGLTLLREMQARGNRTPIVIYAGVRAVERKAELISAGAWGATNEPLELFSLVVTAITNS